LRYRIVFCWYLHRLRISEVWPGKVRNRRFTSDACHIREARAAKIATFPMPRDAEAKLALTTTAIPGAVPSVRPARSIHRADASAPMDANSGVQAALKQLA